MQGVWKKLIFNQYLAVSRKSYKTELSLLWKPTIKLYVVYQMALFSVNDPPNQDFMFMPLFDTQYHRNGMRYRCSYSEILTRTYNTRILQTLTLSDFSDLVKYWVTRSITRSLRDSWASCLVVQPTGSEQWRDWAVAHVFAVIIQVMNLHFVVIIKRDYRSSWNKASYRQTDSVNVTLLQWVILLSASLHVSKRGAYWDRLCRDVVGRWLVGWLVVTRVHCGQTVHPRPIVTMEH